MVVAIVDAGSIPSPHRRNRRDLGPAKWDWLYTPRL